MAKVMISIPGEFLAQIDQVARSRHQTRSEYFRELARRDIEVRREGTGRQTAADGRAEAWARIRAFAERMRGVPWDPVAEIRRMRDAGWSARPAEQVHDGPDEEKAR